MAERRTSSSSFRAVTGASAGASEATAEAHAVLTRVAVPVRALHATLVTHARRAYERENGRIESSTTLLNLLIDSPSFAWLRPLTTLMASIDDVLAPSARDTEIPDPITVQRELLALLDGKRDLDGFTEHFHAAMQSDPDVVVAQGAVRGALSGK